MNWIKVSEQMPPVDTNVLLLHRSGTIYEGILTWEIPGFEDTHKPFMYFVDVDEWNVDWQDSDILYWAPKPEIPELPKGEEGEVV